MIRRITIAGAIFMAFLAVGGVSTGWAQAEEYTVEATWTAPTIGTDPVAYHVWVRSKLDGAETFDKWEEWATTPDLKQVLTFQAGRCYEVKVNAEDSKGIAGPFSIPSVEYCGINISDGNDGPGQPGQPFRTE